jgi:transcriptional regulator with XRE-family HTH domain
MSSSPLQLNVPQDVLRQLADRVRSLRLERAWKQSTLAERAGVSLPTVQRYEQTGRASVETLLRLCHALGRLDEVADLLRPAPSSSLADLEAREQARTGPIRKRGSQ